VVFTINNHEFTNDINGYPSGKMKCLIGYQIQYDQTSQKMINTSMFTGMIGTVLLFSEIFSNDLNKMIFQMRGNYENLLMKTYENHFPRSLEEERIIDSIKQIEKFQIEQNLIMIISSKSLITPSYLNSHMRLNFRENYADFTGNKKLSMIERKYEIMINPTPLNTATYPFEKINFPTEFLKYEGMKFLSLLILFYHQIPTQIFRDPELHNIMYFYKFKFPIDKEV
jgi:hypothetical protein